MIFNRLIIKFLVILLLSCSCLWCENKSNLSKYLLESSKIKSGICVLIGFNNEQLAVELVQSGKILVHGLCKDPDLLQKIRKSITAKHLYGQITFEQYSLKDLPYADHLINLIIINNSTNIFKNGLSMKEILRVTTPGGTIFIGNQKTIDKNSLEKIFKSAGLSNYTIDEKKEGVWAKIIKSRPQGMDTWSHQTHGPDGNLVSKDTVDIPHGIRWIAGPTWIRGPRGWDGLGIFVSEKIAVYVTSNVSDNLDKKIQDVRWYLLAKDAFNGITLWKKPWEGLLIPGTQAKHGYSKSFPKLKKKWFKPKESFFPIPIVAAKKDQLLVPQNNKIASLNPLTGDVLFVSEELDFIPDIVLSRGNHLIVATQTTVYSIDHKSGKIKWKYGARAMDLVMGEENLFFLETIKMPYDLISLNLKSGKENWKINTQKMLACTA